MASEPDQWETQEDLRALARVAAIMKDPKRSKACKQAISAQASAMGMDHMKDMKGKKK